MRKIILIALAALVSVPASGQNTPRASVKFVCGRTNNAVTDNYGFAPGRYYTTINVINQSSGGQQGRKRFSVALPGQQSGRRSPWVDWGLDAGNAMQIDCGDIYKQLNVAFGTFIEGFVTVVAEPRVDVTAVYTVLDGDRRVSMHMQEYLLR